jgi:hypothetical protein
MPPPGPEDEDAALDAFLFDVAQPPAEEAGGTPDPDLWHGLMARWMAGLDPAGMPERDPPPPQDEVWGG